MEFSRWSGCGVESHGMKKFPALALVAVVQQSAVVSGAQNSVGLATFQAIADACLQPLLAMGWQRDDGGMSDVGRTVQNRGLVAVTWEVNRDILVNHCELAYEGQRSKVGHMVHRDLLEFVGHFDFVYMA